LTFQASETDASFHHADRSLPDFPASCCLSAPLQSSSRRPRPSPATSAIITGRVVIYRLGETPGTEHRLIHRNLVGSLPCRWSGVFTTGTSGTNEELLEAGSRLRWSPQRTGPTCDRLQSQRLSRASSRMPEAGRATSPTDDPPHRKGSTIVDAQRIARNWRSQPARLSPDTGQITFSARTPNVTSHPALGLDEPVPCSHLRPLRDPRQWPPDAAPIRSFCAAPGE